jgi:hypothetical protein
MLEIIKNFCQSKSFKDKNLFIKRLEEKGFSESQIATIIQVLENLCPICFDSELPCYGCKEPESVE